MGCITFHVSGTFASWEHTTQATRFSTSWLLNACSPTTPLPWRTDLWVSLHCTSSLRCFQQVTSCYSVALDSIFALGTCRAAHYLHVTQSNSLNLCFVSAVPSENVATIASCASVIEGVSRSRNALLNSDTRNYDWDSGYTCHQLGSGAIVIQLAQPFSIGSLR